MTPIPSIFSPDEQHAYYREVRKTAPTLQEAISSHLAEFGQNYANVETVVLGADVEHPSLEPTALPARYLSGQAAEPFLRDARLVNQIGGQAPPEYRSDNTPFYAYTPTRLVVMHFEDEIRHYAVWSYPRHPSASGAPDYQ